MTGAARSGSREDLGRVEALENIAKSILQRIQEIEERIKALEAAEGVSGLPLPSRETGASSIPSSAPVPQVVSGVQQVTMDPGVLKKDLFAKMWKYLNDTAAA